MTYMQIADAFTYVDDEYLCLVEQMRKPRRKWRGALKKVAAVILALLIGAGVWLTVDEGARAAFQRWWREVYENSVIYRFAGDTEGTLPLYAPMWMPEGYELVSDYSDSVARSMYYMRESDGDVMLFNYSYMTNNISLELFDADGLSDPQTISVNGLNASFYPAGGTSQTNNLIWIDELHNIIFSVNSGLGKDIMLRIAESVALETQTQPALPLYAPTWVPEGFELEDDYSDQEARNMYYTREADGKMVAFDYSYMHSGTAIQIFNPEGVPDSEKAMVNGMKAYFYPAGGSSKMASVIWIDEAQNIVFSIDSGLSKDEILRIAESVALETQAQPALPRYAPTWVPEGFELEGNYLAENHRVLIYNNNEINRSIVFDYFYMDEGAQIELHNMDRVDSLETMGVNGAVGNFYPPNDNSENGDLIWFDETKNIVFAVSCNLSKADILRIAESVRIEG